MLSRQQRVQVFSTLSTEPEGPSQTPDTGIGQNLKSTAAKAILKSESNKSGFRIRSPRLANAAQSAAWASQPVWKPGQAKTGSHALANHHEDHSDSSCDLYWGPQLTSVHLGVSNFPANAIPTPNSHKHLAALSYEASSSGSRHSFTAAKKKKNSKANYRTMAQVHGRRGTSSIPPESHIEMCRINCIALH